MVSFVAAFGIVFKSTPKPEMFVPEPGMNSVVVTPPATVSRIRAALGRTTSRVLSSALIGCTMSLMSPIDPLTWWCRSTNPGVIVDPGPMDRDLRFGTDYDTPRAETEFHFRRFGSFAGAVEQCSGVGACRQTLVGTMCPSYRITRDEKHSPRGRANTLRLAMTGQLGTGGPADDAVAEAMELCLSCKACKSECPSNVDVARLKSQHLQARHDAYGAPFREKLVAATAARATARANRRPSRSSIIHAAARKAMART